MARTTSALVIREQGKPFSLESISVEKPRDDEVLVEIHASGLCHSDLACASGKIPMVTPIVLGHEGAGVVVKVGSNVSHVTPGDKVLLSYTFCGVCDDCKSGFSCYCRDFLALNLSGQRRDGTTGLALQDGTKLHGNFFGQSSFAGLALVDKSSLVKVPDDSPLDLFAPLGCALQTGVGAIINTLDVQPGSSVAVFGTGSVGLSAIMACKIRQAKTIIAVDIDTTRLQIAQDLGATAVVDAADPDVAQRIREICKSNGVRYAVDCSGVIKVIETMIDALGTKGRACSVGIPDLGSRVSVDVHKHMYLGKEYVACTYGDSVFQEMAELLIDYHRKGQLPLEKIVTKYDIKDHDQALQDVKQGKTIKAVFVWKK